MSYDVTLAVLHHLRGTAGAELLKLLLLTLLLLMLLARPHAEGGWSWP